MRGIPPEFYGVGGPAAMLAGLFWMLATGRLLTRREADTIRADRDDWRAAHGAEVVKGQVLYSQVTELLEHARVTATFMGALSEIANREKP